MPLDPHPAPIGAPASASVPPDAGCLPRGYRLRDFVIERVLAEGGFGVVYVAIDARLRRRVAIKEYMPASLARRGVDLSVQPRSSVPMQDAFVVGLRSFINEARLLAGFDHPALVRVLQFWEDKGTGFIVMPLYQAPTVRQWTLAQDETPDADWLVAFVEPLLEALELVHGAACLHRDIAPDNVLIQRERDPLLLDFGAARRVIEEMTQTLTAIVKPGYAPIEQYAQSTGLRQGPWTDLYALCATVHFMLTRRAPPPAVARMVADEYVPLAQALRGRYPLPLLAAVDAGLAVRPADRPQSVAQFRALLGSDAQVALAEPVARTAAAPVVAPDVAVAAPVAAATLPVPRGTAAEAGPGHALAGVRAQDHQARWADVLLRRPLPPRAVAVAVALSALFSTAWFWPRNDVPATSSLSSVHPITTRSEVVPGAILPITRPELRPSVPTPAASAGEEESAVFAAYAMPSPAVAALADATVTAPRPPARTAPAAAAAPSAQRIAELARLRADAARRTGTSSLDVARDDGGPAEAAVLAPKQREDVPMHSTAPAPASAKGALAPTTGAATTAVSDRLHIIDQPPPRFPFEAARDGIQQGRVVARLHVDADGRVGKVDIIESAPRLAFDRAVRSAARHWRYEPPGQPRAVEVEFVFRRDS
jgi:TonB family protein